MAEECSPIGIFDSGVGGLTVCRQIAWRLPDEHLVYLGDTARVPYGTKSPETVIRYARACAEVLLGHHIKLLVVACNTASSCAIAPLREALDIPVIGVIGPGARAAAAKTRGGGIGVIGTDSTIASGAYPRSIAAVEPDIAVHCRACPLFVPLAEEGWTAGEVPEAVARTYLGGLAELGIDTLVLGCTHYPLLRETIACTMGPAVALVDSAEETAAVAEQTLDAAGLRRPSAGTPTHRFLVSDGPARFATVGRRFFGAALDSVTWVDF